MEAPQASTGDTGDWIRVAHSRASIGVVRKTERSCSGSLDMHRGPWQSKQGLLHSRPIGNRPARTAGRQEACDIVSRASLPSQSGLPGAEGRLGSVNHLQFGEDGRYVVLNCLQADVERVGDLRIGASLGDERQDL